MLMNADLTDASHGIARIQWLWLQKEVRNKYNVRFSQPLTFGSIQIIRFLWLEIVTPSFVLKMHVQFSADFRRWKLQS